LTSGQRRQPSSPSCLGALRLQSKSALPLFNPAMTKTTSADQAAGCASAPLAVRRTPDTPRLRAVRGRPRVLRPARAAVSEELEATGAAGTTDTRPVERLPSRIITGQSSRPGARVIAVLIDHLILFGSISRGVFHGAHGRTVD